MFKTFHNWLFDGSINSKIPKSKKDDNNKVIIPDILKYNSPITHTYLLSIFLKNGSLNFYLDNIFNNIGLRYLDKEELFYFIKKCVIDFRISRRSLLWVKYNNKTTLFNKVRTKLPILKNDDIDLICELIEKSKDKDQIYISLGLDKPIKKKLRQKKKNKLVKKITLKKFLLENFSLMNVES